MKSTHTTSNTIPCKIYYEKQNSRIFNVFYSYSFLNPMNNLQEESDSDQSEKPKKKKNKK